MRQKLIERQGVKDLRECILKNRRFYQGGGFEKQIPSAQIMDVPLVHSVRVDEGALSRLNPENTRKAEIENALLVWNSLKGVNPYLARDEGFWVYLTHFPCREYAWACTLHQTSTVEGLEADVSGGEKKTLEESILENFFTREEKDRDFVRNNAVARLWWWAYIANRYERESLEKTLEVLLSTADLRVAIIERPSLTRGKEVFSALMDVLMKRYDSESQHIFFKRTPSQTPYREWMKEINRHGGLQLLESMSRDELKGLFEHLAVQAEQG